MSNYHIRTAKQIMKQSKAFKNRRSYIISKIRCSQNINDLASALLAYKCMYGDLKGAPKGTHHKICDGQFEKAHAIMNTVIKEVSLSQDCDKHGVTPKRTSRGMISPQYDMAPPSSQALAQRAAHNKKHSNHAGTRFVPKKKKQTVARWSEGYANDTF